MTLKELIRKRIEENVADYDISKIERYEYLFEMIAIEFASEQVKNISSKPVLCDSLPTDCIIHSYDLTGKCMVCGFKLPDSL